MKKISLSLFFTTLAFFAVIQTVNGQSNNNEQLKLIGKWMHEEGRIIIEFTQTTYTNHTGSNPTGSLADFMVVNGAIFTNRSLDYVIENGAIVLLSEMETPWGIFNTKIDLARSFEFIDYNTLKFIDIIDSNYFTIYNRME
jgi:hypothetical protein